MLNEDNGAIPPNDSVNVCLAALFNNCDISAALSADIPSVKDSTNASLYFESEITST